MGQTCCNESKQNPKQNPDSQSQTTILFPFYVQQIKLIQEETEKSVQDVYQMQEIINEGQSCVIQKALHSQTQIMRAVKNITKSKCTLTNDYEKEIEISKQMDHPNIVKIIEYYQDEKQCSLVMELLEGGSLLNRILRQRKLTENEAANYMGQILSGVAYMHSMSIIHNKITPENLVFDSYNKDATIKIIDFGNKRPNLPPLINGLSYGGMALNLFAPEIVQEKINEKIDI